MDSYSEFDLGTGSYQAEFDFGIYTWNGTTPATCGSDDSFDFLITTDGGATWTSLFSADGNYATSIGGDRQFSDLSAYSGVVQFAFATDGVIDDPQDVDFTIDNFALINYYLLLIGYSSRSRFPTLHRLTLFSQITTRLLLVIMWLSMVYQDSL